MGGPRTAPGGGDRRAHRHLDTTSQKGLGAKDVQAHAAGAAAQVGEKEQQALVLLRVQAAPRSPPGKSRMSHLLKMMEFIMGARLRGRMMRNRDRE
jgi:hypothetical protein